MKRAAEAATGETRAVLTRAAELCAHHFAEAETLSGPTGESNTLRLKGRGIVVCLGGGGLGEQLALALAAGNCVIAPPGAAEPLAAALVAAGFPGAVRSLPDIDRAVPAGLLQDPRVRAAVFDGTERRPLIETLAARSGPIIPLLSSADAPWRFAVERTLSINTTAAGGDVRLLSLAD